MSDTDEDMKNRAKRDLPQVPPLPSASDIARENVERSNTLWEGYDPQQEEESGNEEEDAEEEEQVQRSPSRTSSKSSYTVDETNSGRAVKVKDSTTSKDKQQSVATESSSDFVEISSINPRRHQPTVHPGPPDPPTTEGREGGASRLAPRVII